MNSLLTLHSTFDRTRLLKLEEWLEKDFPETWPSVKEELNANLPPPNELGEFLPPDELAFLEPEMPEEQPVFKSSLNIRGSEGFDAERAGRDREAFEKRVGN